VIALVRVDNRLVHGQILEAWVPHLGARRVMVADDDAAKNSLAKAAMTLAVSPDLAISIEPVDRVDWEGLVRTPEAVLVLVREVVEARRAYQCGMTPVRAPRINLGNVHFTAGRKPVTASVFLSAEELKEVQGLAAAGFAVEARAIPSDAPVGVAELVRIHGEAQ
jgi:PTS system mannose-specific IIB component